MRLVTTKAEEGFFSFERLGRFLYLDVKMRCGITRKYGLNVARRIRIDDVHGTLGAQTREDASSAGVNSFLQPLNSPTFVL